MNRPFTRGMIVHLRNAYHLRSHRQRLLDAGMLTVSELARHLGIHFQTVKHWRRDGIITGVLANDKGEYVHPLPGPELVRPVIGRPRRSVLDPEHSATTR
ncbi:helix-turn-helix domain-containing protein [Streptomyces atratus]